MVKAWTSRTRLGQEQRGKEWRFIISARSQSPALSIDSAIAISCPPRNRHSRKSHLPFTSSPGCNVHFAQGVPVAPSCRVEITCRIRAGEGSATQSGRFSEGIWSYHFTSPSRLRLSHSKSSYLRLHSFPLVRLKHLFKTSFQY